MIKTSDPCFTDWIRISRMSIDQLRPVRALEVEEVLGFATLALGLVGVGALALQ
jgi:hypothetical protein